jgi:hypothetical protein
MLDRAQMVSKNKYIFVDQDVLYARLQSPLHCYKNVKHAFLTRKFKRKWRKVELIKGTVAWDGFFGLI